MSKQKVITGQTHQQYRATLLSGIKSEYREYATAKEKSEKYMASNRPVKAVEWGGRMRSAIRNLEIAFKKLPEVMAGDVDMDAVTFAKSLLDPPSAPKIMPGQVQFIEQG